MNIRSFRRLVRGFCNHKSVPTGQFTRILVVSLRVLNCLLQLHTSGIVNIGNLFQPLGLVDDKTDTPTMCSRKTKHNYKDNFRGDVNNKKCHCPNVKVRSIPLSNTVIVSKKLYSNSVNRSQTKKSLNRMQTKYFLLESSAAFASLDFRISNHTSAKHGAPTFQTEATKQMYHFCVQKNDMLWAG